MARTGKHRFAVLRRSTDGCACQSRCRSITGLGIQVADFAQGLGDVVDSDILEFLDGVGAAHQCIEAHLPSSCWLTMLGRRTKN